MFERVGPDVASETLVGRLQTRNNEIGAGDARRWSRAISHDRIRDSSQRVHPDLGTREMEPLL